MKRVNQIFKKNIIETLILETLYIELRLNVDVRAFKECINVCTSPDHITVLVIVQHIYAALHNSA